MVRTMVQSAMQSSVRDAGLARQDALHPAALDEVSAEEMAAEFDHLRLCSPPMSPGSNQRVRLFDHLLIDETLQYHVFGRLHVEKLYAVLIFQWVGIVFAIVCLDVADNRLDVQ